MINTEHPDYSNTPAAEARPHYSYLPRDTSAPFVSIITPFYNTPPDIFQQTVRSVLRMSLANWEWIIVDDESGDETSLAALREVAASDPRIRVIRQPNGGPAVARNHAAREARGKYLLQLDSDDLMEPTFVEKAVWFLETQPQFAAANSYNVTFGSKTFLWPNGFHEYAASLDDNRMTMQAVIRTSAFFRAGGYDESISYEHADWDFWLDMAEVGLWGFTLPEYLTWYRTQTKSLMTEIEGDRARAQRFRNWLHTKHAGLRGRFPHPVWTPGRDVPHAAIREEIPVENALLKPDGVKRILFLVPWLEMGGSDKFNVDVICQLSQRGYEFTVVSSISARHVWLSEFTSLTPDVFCLEKFLSYADYPRFLNYLIASRQIDAVLISNSQLAYLLTPYLRATHSNLPILDYNHMEIEDWQDGGYPAHAVRLGQLLDLNVVNTQHLSRWMVKQGSNPDQIDVCYCNCDTAEWTLEGADRAAIRAEHNIPADTPLILFAGRVVSQKRPLFFVDILQRLAAVEPDFVALVAGSGDLLDGMRDRARAAGLRQRMRFLGAVPSERMRDLMCAADILLLPSDHEGLALVLFEAMAMETVPVGADVGGQRELVTSDCGYLIPHAGDEVEQYVAALIELIRDPQRRAQMAARGRARVAEHFDLRLMADGMERAIARATERAAARRPADLALPMARESAHVAIEYIRMEEVANMLWNERSKLPPVQFIRALRERVLPIGSDRYEVYKKFRQGLRRLRRAPVVLRRQLAHRAAGEALPTPAAVRAAVASVATPRERVLAPESEPVPEQVVLAVPVVSDSNGFETANHHTGARDEHHTAPIVPHVDAAGNGE